MYSLDDFNMTKENLGEAIDGGEINVAIVSSTPFAGTLIHIYQTMTTDYSILSWFNDGLLERDENFFYSQDGPATFELDDSKKVWTLTIRDNVNWHDGEPVTAEDLELAYKIIGHPEYDGTYYDSDYEMLKETGEADFDVFMGSAGLFSNPDPRIFNGPSSSFNYPRWQSDETNELLAAGGSIEAFDTDYLKEVYDEWQAIMVEEVPQFPTRYGTSMMAINNRILNYSLDRGDEKTYYYELAVTQDEPFVDGE